MNLAAMEWRQGPKFKERKLTAPNAILAAPEGLLLTSAPKVLSFMDF